MNRAVVVYALIVAAGLGVGIAMVCMPLERSLTLGLLVAGALVTLVTVFYAFGKPLETLRGALCLGLLLGLTFLARFDALLFGAVLLAAAVLAGAGGARLTRRLALTTVAGAAALAICIPWFIFSLKATGTMLPTSGEAIAVWSSNPWPTVSSPTHAAKTLLYVLAPVANDICHAALYDTAAWIAREAPPRDADWRRSYHEVFGRDDTYRGGERREGVLVLERRPKVR